MHDDRELDGDPLERELFRSLASGSPGSGPSGDLEDRIVGALKRRGLIASSRFSPWSWRRLRWDGASVRPSPWRRLAQAGVLAAALVVAFLFGTYYGKRDEQRAARAEPPTSIPSPALAPGEGEPWPLPHSGAMLTAFHMNQDHPLVVGPADYGQDPLGISGKPFQP